MKLLNFFGSKKAQAPALEPSPAAPQWLRTPAHSRRTEEIRLNRKVARTTPHVFTVERFEFPAGRITSEDSWVTRPGAKQGDGPYWSHQVVLHGLTWREAKSYGAWLTERLSSEPVNTASVGIQMEVNSFLESSLSHLSQPRSFFTPTAHLSELAARPFEDRSSRHEIIATAEYCRESGVPLQLAYMSPRPDYHGKLTPQLRVHRIEVVELQETWLRGLTDNKFRSFSLDKIAWVAAEGFEMAAVRSSPSLIMKLDPTGGHLLLAAFTGEMLKAPKRFTVIGTVEL